MQDLTREQAIQKIQEILSEESGDKIEDILNQIYEFTGRNEWVRIVDLPSDIYSLTKEQLIEEARTLIATPEKPQYLVERFNDIYTQLQDIAEQELPEDNIDEYATATVVDQWISG